MIFYKSLCTPPTFDPTIHQKQSDGKNGYSCNKGEKCTKKKHEKISYISWSPEYYIYELIKQFEYVVVT